MRFQRNTPGQKWAVLAIDRNNNNAPVTGGAANITAKLRKDYGTATATDDTNPTELESGWYEFDLSREESNAGVMQLIPVSATSGVEVIPVGGVVSTERPAEHAERLDSRRPEYAGLRHRWCPDLDSSGDGTTTLTDLVGDADGTLTNMDAATDWVDDGGEKMIDFDGTDDVVLCGNISTFDYVRQCAISLWLKFDDHTVEQQFLRQRTSGSNRIEIGLNSSEQIVVTFRNGGGAQSVFDVSATLADDTLHHVGVSYDGWQVGDARLRLYFDGVEIEPTSSTPPEDRMGIYSSDPLQLGSTVDYFSGRLAEVCIFDLAKTPDEMAVLADDNLRGSADHLNRSLQRVVVDSIDGGATEAKQDQIITDIGNLPAATDIVSGGAITTSAGKVVGVETVDTTTTNTDMRGTDGANTVTPNTVTPATPADVAAITQAQRLRISLPAQLERPDSGSLTYRIWMYAYDEQHQANNLDSNPVVAVENNTGTDRSSNLGTVTQQGGIDGVYYVDYTVADSHAIEGLNFKVDATEDSTTTQYPAASLVVDTTAVDFTAADRTKLEDIHTNADATVSSRSTLTTGDILTAFDFSGSMDDKLAEILAGAAGGDGANTVLITVHDTGSNPIENAVVRITAPGFNEWLPTNSSGQCTFSLDDGTYTIAITKSGVYNGLNETLVISGEPSPALDPYELTLISTATPAAANLAVGRLIMLNENGVPEEDAKMNFRMTAAPTGDGYAYDAKIITVTSDADGLIEFNGFVQGATYNLWRGEATPTSGSIFASRDTSRSSFPVPAASSFDIQSVLGIDPES